MKPSMKKYDNQECNAGDQKHLVSFKLITFYHFFCEPISMAARPNVEWVVWKRLSWELQLGVLEQYANHDTLNIWNFDLNSRWWEKVLLLQGWRWMESCWRGCCGRRKSKVADEVDDESDAGVEDKAIEDRRRFDRWSAHGSQHPPSILRHLRAQYSSKARKWIL